MTPLPHTHRPVIAVLQARMSSSRLPGKVLKPLQGSPMLLHQIRRVQRARLLDGLVVATSDRDDDTPIESLCRDNDIPCFRGPLDNVLERFYQAAKAHKARTIVRLTGDCPLADPEKIDDLIAQFIGQEADYAINCIPPQLPHGLDAEVFSFDCLKEARAHARLPSELEHVTPYMRKPESGFKLTHTQYPDTHAHHRWCVDEPEDFQLVQAVYDALYPENPRFTTRDILNLLEQQPEIPAINAHIDSRAQGQKRDQERDNEFLAQGTP